MAIAKLCVVSAKHFPIYNLNNTWHRNHTLWRFKNTVSRKCNDSWKTRPNPAKHNIVNLFNKKWHPFCSEKINSNKIKLRNTVLSRLFVGGRIVIHYFKCFCLSFLFITFPFFDYWINPIKKGKLSFDRSRVIVRVQTGVLTIRKDQRWKYNVVPCPGWLAQGLRFFCTGNIELPLVTQEYKRCWETICPCCDKFFRNSFFPTS